MVIPRNNTLVILPTTGKQYRSNYRCKDLWGQVEYCHGMLDTFQGKIAVSERHRQMQVLDALFIPPTTTYYVVLLSDLP